MNYLIDFSDTANQSEIDDYLLRYQCSVLTAFDNLNLVYHVHSTVLPPITTIVTSVQNDDISTIRLLDATPVVIVPPANTIDIDVNNQHNWWKTYSLNRIDLADSSITASVYGQNTNVYLVDSGVDISHPEFAGADISLVYSISGDISDNTGHGTSLASVIVGNTCGMTAASLKIVKIFDSSIPTKQSDLLKAFDSILNDMLTSDNNFSVINLSWSIVRNIYIEEKIRFLIAAGAVVVASAGNSGLPIGDVTPAAMREVITIGSYGPTFLPSDFTDYTNPTITSLTQAPLNEGILDSWAPGEQIWSAKMGGGYGFTGGTSAAAAIYSASVAYNRSRWLKPTGVPYALFSTPDGIAKMDLVVHSDRSGLLNLSDPRYSSSANKICTYQNADHPQISVNPVFITRAVRVGDTQSIRLFHPQSVSSYEWITPLPAFIVDDTSFLLVSPTSEPTTSNGAEQYDLIFRVTPIDGSPPIDNNLTLIVLSTNFDQAALPDDDPLLTITLLAGCVSLANCTTCIGSDYCTVTYSSKSCRCYTQFEPPP